MIQRIQTLYLFLAIACFGILFFTPVIRFTKEGEMVNGSVPTQQVELRLTGKYIVEGSGEPAHVENYWAEELMAAILMLLLGYIIFQYKNRGLQIIAGRLALLTSSGLLVLLFSTVSKELGEANSHKAYGIGTYLPVIAIVCIFLAIRAIRNDEALVRAADRIR